MSRNEREKFGFSCHATNLYFYTTKTPVLWEAKLIQLWIPRMLTKFRSAINFAFLRVFPGESTYMATKTTSTRLMFH